MHPEDRAKFYNRWWRIQHFDQLPRRESVL